MLGGSFDSRKKDAKRAGDDFEAEVKGADDECDKEDQCESDAAEEDDEWPPERMNLVDWPRLELALGGVWKRVWRGGGWGV